MSAFVVDSSVGIKWFLPELHADAARRLYVVDHDLHVPDFFDIEIANILWKKVRRGELARTEADMMLAQLSLLPVERHAESTFLAQAFEIANQTQRTVYDSIYVALANEIGAPFVTADERLVNSLTNTPWASHVCFVGDIP